MSVTKRTIERDLAARSAIYPQLSVVGFAVGDKVEHKVFGIGVVIEAISGRDSYKVKFEKGTRNLVGRVLKRV